MSDYIGSLPQPPHNTNCSIHSLVQDICANVIRMKVINPSMKFRVEMNLGCLETIKTTQTSEQGLEANEVFFVELDVYRKTHGEPDPRDVIWDTLPDGTRAQGVNVQAGEKGWWKRIDRRVSGVKREAQLNDENIDPTGEALDHIETAAKRAMLKDVRPALFVERGPSSSSRPEISEPSLSLEVYDFIIGMGVSVKQI